MKFFYISIPAFFAVFAADRLTKYVAISQEISWWPTSWFGFELVFNKGVAWSFLQDKWEVILLLVAAALIFLVGHMVQQIQLKRLLLAEFCILAGALSNLFDRFVYGGVVDFIAVTIFGWQFPIFNIADIAICCGGAWILYQEFVYEQHS